MVQTHIQELEACCSSCPDPNDVEVLLREFGLKLTFTMKAVARRRVETSIAAQYHFEGPDGAEILYLAGRDVGDGEVRLPPHASRFWAIAGADLGMYRKVISALSGKWALQWKPTGETGKVA